MSLSVDGGLTEWLNWSGCSVLCGPYGTRTRKRFCAKPLPQFGGKDCKGEREEHGKCVDNPPCPGESIREHILNDLNVSS